MFSVLDDANKTYYNTCEREQAKLFIEESNARLICGSRCSSHTTSLYKINGKTWVEIDEHDGKNYILKQRF